MVPRSTVEAVEAAPEEAIAFLRSKANVGTQRWTDIWQEAHSHSFMVAGAASEALVADFRRAVAQALEQGTTLDAFRGEFDRIVEKHGWVHNGTPAWRAQIIYETNLSGAYSAGRYVQMTEPDTLRVYPYWQYQHTSSAHPRPQHLAWVGTTLRADDAWWSTHYPPNGWRCKCWVRPVSAAGLGRMGKDGPDTAPPLDLRPVRLPAAPGRPEQVVEVPHGIDPGFGHNPGQAWQSGGTPGGAPGGDLPPPRRPGKMPPAEAVPSPVPEAGPSAPARKPPGVEALPPTPAASVPVPGAMPLEMPVPARLPGQTAAPLQALTVQSLDGALTELWRPWAETLSVPEQAALDAYKGAFGRRLNRVLRGEPDNPVLEQQARDLVQALGRATAPVGARLYRGIGQEELQALYAGRSVGDVVRSAAIVSATISPAEAERIAAMGQALVELLIPRGLVGAAYVHPFPRYRFRQYEMLLRPRIGLRILQIGSGRIVVEAEHGGRGDR